MQVNEELIRQITSAVLNQMSQSDHVSSASGVSSQEIPSMIGRERINEVKTSYADYPRAKKGSDPKEVVIGVGAAFQKEITKTICGIPLDEVLKNIKAGIEEEGMIPRVIKILDTSDVCFMALEAAKYSGSGIGVGIQSKGTTVIHQKATISAFQSGTVSASAAYDLGDIPPNRKKRSEICQRRAGRSDSMYQRPDVQTEISGESCDHAYRRDRAA